ncbi:MAG: hypothetical protein AAB893_02795, partial [Patescibacteria group bacterium]
IVGVVDFDISFYTYFIYDIAAIIYWWAWPPKTGFNVEKMQFVLKEYSKNRKLNKIEIEHIYDALKLIILLGISWSSEEDFEQDKRKIEYLNLIGKDKFVKESRGSWEGKGK